LQNLREISEAPHPATMILTFPSDRQPVFLKKIMALTNFDSGHGYATSGDGF
jgi:hypothetical protein